MKLKYRTRGKSSPAGKPRIYFSCHPDDFAKCLDKICEDILKLQDCAIYYYETKSDGEENDESSDAHTDEDYQFELRQMNLFVIPVSFKLLSTPNRCMDHDLRFAQEEHIPVLPLKLEPRLNDLFKKRFGSLQYLDPYSMDETAISYEVKLKKYLESILVGPENAERIRSAFSDYIFLSYRKKDRKFANELMRLIHRYPMCWDVAIWYDEFLVPGENYNDSIAQMLKKSGLFTLLVTPNLVNEDNYVMRVEYPEARKYNKDIFPVEMVETDREKLAQKYEELPPCIAGKEGPAEVPETCGRIRKQRIHPQLSDRSCLSGRN